MTIDILTIVVCGILLLLAITTPLCNGLFRKPASTKETDDTQERPRFSIVITVHDNAEELERNLPVILAQEYEPGFEVVVVDESSTDDTEDVIKRLRNKHPNLYATFIPESSHYLSRRKLALTLGVKAAKNEWIIFTDVDCAPESNKWLESMSDCCSKDYDLVLGYTNYAQESKKYYRFERLLTSCYLLRKAQTGMAYRYNGNNLAMRKSVFMSNNGFLQNLKYLRGEYDFIVNEYTTPGRTNIAIEQEAHVCQDAPSKSSWINFHLYYMETRKHLKRSLPYRLLFDTDTVLLHLNYIAQIAAVAYSVLFQNWIITIGAVIGFIITVTLRIVIAGKAIRRFDESIPRWAVPLMEIRVMWQNLSFILRHRISDKYNFIRR